MSRRRAAPLLYLRAPGLSAVGFQIGDSSLAPLRIRISPTSLTEIGADTAAK